MMCRETKPGVVFVLLTGAFLGGCGGGGGGDTSDELSSTTTTTYSIGGSVSGLASGSTLVLQNSGGDDLSVTADGSFTFDTEVTDGSSYTVIVSTQPSSNSQYCMVIDGSGTVSAADVSGVAVKCIQGLYNVVDTQQSTCYNSDTGAAEVCSGTGYDADYAGNASDYTLSDDGSMVFDNVTGLIWTQTPDVDGSGAVDVDDKLTQPEAVSYCASLSTGGYDWRLPSIKELYSLMDFRGTDPSGYSGTDTSGLTPFIDDSVFEPGYGDTDAGERLIDGQFATISIYVSPAGTLYGEDTMFGVNFADGRIKGYPYDYPSNDPKTFYVLCVSGNEYYGSNDFSDNGDGTIDDDATGLKWQQDDYHSTNFEDAIDYCEGLTLGGSSDWRLPNIKELQSIADYERAPDATSSAAIDELFNATSFSNEGGETDWGYYWASTTHLNYLDLGNNGTYISFGRALGYYDEGSGLAVTDVHGAGAQRSNDKSDLTSDGTAANVGFGVFYYHGPQGDILRLDNRVRCVTDI